MSSRHDDRKFPQNSSGTHPTRRSEASAAAVSGRVFIKGPVRSAAFNAAKSKIVLRQRASTTKQCRAPASSSNLSVAGTVRAGAWLNDEKRFPFKKRNGILQA